MSPLLPGQFAAFFEAVHGVPPLPWQSRLAQQVLAGEWPDTIAMPTASGKTAVLDIAVFALAAGTPGKHARRVFFVVDRRVVVDEALERAQRIERCLATAKDGVLGQVAAALRARGGDEDCPLATAIMRGGLYRDDRWARSPVQPTLVLSTVDQVGSRLLFRGYGISPRARAIHAGLVGNDSLIILDEAHCSRPFSETLGWVRHFRSRRWAEEPIEAPFGVVSMTATPRPGGRRFEAQAEDLAHPVLAARFGAGKQAQLLLSKKDDDAFVKAMAGVVTSWATEPRVIGAIVNRVAVARALLGALKTSLKASADVVLLTGRVRSEERDEVIRRLAPRLKADPHRAPTGRSLVVVATQCIEVGADLDFDALVTECASLDALRQRFGRANRLGRSPSSPSAVVMRDLGPKEIADPVYGVAMQRTWAWLNQHASVEDELRSIDFGVSAMAKLIAAAGDELSGLLAPSLPAPVLTPAHLDCLVQTGPEPHVSPDPAAYLHGVKRQSADVNLVWRADLPELAADCWADCVSTAPPMSGETMAVPISAARAWLQAEEAPALADVEGVTEPEPTQPKPGLAPPVSRAVLRWRGPEADGTMMVTARDLRPGDTLIVPATWGGCDEFGWNPASISPVADLTERLQSKRRRAVLRLHPDVMAGWPEGFSGSLRALVSAGEEGLEDLEAAREALARAAESAPEDALGRVAGFLSRDRATRFSAHPSGQGIVVSSPRLLPRLGAEGADVTDEDETSSASSRAVELLPHLEHVGDEARAFLSKLAVSRSLAESIVLACRCHDLGKSDPRFQLWLHGGDRLAQARCGVALAKSGGAPRRPAAMQAARKAAGYPSGSRHELVSVRLAEKVVENARVDGALVLQLVGAHHGYCRPFAPLVLEGEASMARLTFDGLDLEVSTDTGLGAADAGVVERFWGVVRRYGWWGEAWAEAVMRLADHRASQREQEEAP